MDVSESTKAPMAGAGAGSVRVESETARQTVALEGERLSEAFAASSERLAAAASALANCSRPRALPTTPLLPSAGTAGATRASGVRGRLICRALRRTVVFSVSIPDATQWHKKKSSDTTTTTTAAATAKRYAVHHRTR